MKPDFTQVTEVTDEDVSKEQIQRMYTRYHFAKQYCYGKDVLELACGCGQGLGYLAKTAKNIIAGDYSERLLKIAKRHYLDRMPLVQLDAQILPFKDKSFDVIILFEAIYYLKGYESFVRECVRVLRPHGTLLICTANKDLPDFNPSPYSYRYFSPSDFIDLLIPWGFHVKCFGDCPVNYHSLKKQILSLIKRTMVRLDLMPKTMKGKKLFKRIVFGKLVPLSPELTEDTSLRQLPCHIPSDKADTYHKVIFAVAQREIA